MRRYTYVAVEGSRPIVGPDARPTVYWLSLRSAGALVAVAVGVPEGAPNTGDGVIVTYSPFAIASTVYWQPEGPAQ